jgi:hypothetical protein
MRSRAHAGCAGAAHAVVETGVTHAHAQESQDHFHCRLAILALAASAALTRVHAGEKAAAQTAPAVDPQLARMQEQMKLMQSQMEKLGKTQDPKERQRLLQEHMASMQAMMATMPGNSCDHMMPMHQMMMDQMMQHQHAMMAPAPN